MGRNFSGFWRRWHVTLSAWLRDYLYISLGGNRRGAVRTYVHLMLTMLLGGLWHGASWLFVLWGMVSIHRSNRSSAIQSMSSAVRAVDQLDLTQVGEVVGLEVVERRRGTLPAGQIVDVHTLIGQLLLGNVRQW